MPFAASRRPRAAWAVWGIGAAAYMVAVFQRGSLGVASLEAQHRFHASASILSLFAVLQLAVYAGLQIPVGVVLDRVGTRRLVAVGAVVMALGQVTLALATTVPLAVLARVLVGTGDAMTFISVLRLVGWWFPPRQAPLVTQLTAVLGQLGQVAAAYPLVALLKGVGWTPSFLGAAAVGGAVGVVALVAVRDRPPEVARPDLPPLDLGAVRDGLAEAWSQPGTRLGFWTHFTTQFSGNTFGLLWGYPFLVSAEGRSPETAGLLLSLMVVVAIGAGPLLGRITGRWPRRRSRITLTVVGVTAAVWTAVLAWPHRAPVALLVVLVVVLSTNGPGSMVGLDYARTHNRAGLVGSASGIVNVGGFAATLLLIEAIGLVLGGSARGTAYTVGQFRVAWSLQYVGWALGLAMVLRSRRLLRRQDADRQLEAAAVS